MSILITGKKINGATIVIAEPLPHNMPSTGYCSFPLCKRIIDRGTHCFLHAKSFEPAKAAKAKMPIPKLSVRRKRELPIYRRIVADVLGKDDRCKIKSPVCTGKAQGLNHTVKRSPANLIEPTNLVAACNACNNFLESNSKWALVNGHTISKFKK